MLRFIRKWLYRNGWEKVTYQDIMRYYPLHKMISSTIACAMEERATSITFGLPPGMELSNEDESWIRTRHEEIIANMPKQDNSVNVLKDDDSGRFHRRDGLPEIPCWFKNEERWYLVLGVTTCLYAYLPQFLCDRLVSLDGKISEGGKEKWIEYTDIVGAENRKFVRVKLVFEVNNSVTIELLESRIVPKDAVVMWRHWRV
jgi:hypothetical protein